MSRKNSGFSLIELMIVVAIIGIISAIAYPSYTKYVQRSHRAEIAELMAEAAQTLERHYSRAGQYTNSTTPAVTTADPVGNAWYTLAVNRQTTTFTLVATPIAGTMMATDMCGSFTLDNTGARGNTGTSTGATTAICWGR
ncbi:MAG: type IV pilin protein [Janthinobacterium lividum]